MELWKPMIFLFQTGDFLFPLWITSPAKFSIPPEKWWFGRQLSSSRWWFQIFFIFVPKFGEDEPNLTSIFFKWVETTNQSLKNDPISFTWYLIDGTWGCLMLRVTYFSFYFKEAYCRFLAFGRDAEQEACKGQSYQIPNIRAKAWEIAIIFDSSKI